MPLTDQEKIYKLEMYLDGCINWMEAIQSLIENTDCNPDDPREFDEVIVSASLMKNNAKEVLNEVRRNQDIKKVS